jgi:cell division septal protein FtsQ
MTEHKQYSSEKFEQKRRKKRIIKFSILVGLFVLLFFSVSYYSGHKSITISTIEISATNYLDEEFVINEVQQMLAGRYFFLFARNNFLILPKTEIKENILSQNVFIEDVSIEVRGLNHLVINIYEHGPVAKWCMKNSGSCYLVNQDGLIYVEEARQLNSNHTLQFSDDKIISLFGAYDDTEDVIGQYYLESNLFRSVLNLIKKLEELGFKVSHLNTRDHESITIYSEERPYLLISKYSNLEQVFQNLKTTIETEELNRAQLGNLEYIDLRFGNKVYYKIK